MVKGYPFKLAGSFGGVTSFDDEGERVNFLKINYLGGKATVSITDEEASKLSEVPEGADVRAEGDVLVSGGSFRPVLRSYSFEGQPGFNPIDFDEACSGLIFSGVGFITRKRAYERKKDGSLVCNVDLMLFGATLKDFPVEPEQFQKIDEGQVRVVGRILSEIKKDFNGNLKSSNWMVLLQARSPQERPEREGRRAKA